MEISNWFISRENTWRIVSQKLRKEEHLYLNRVAGSRNWKFFVYYKMTIVYLIIVHSAVAVWFIWNRFAVAVEM